MRSITMTEAETAIYDDGTEEAQRALMADLRRRAEADRQDGETVEIYTVDGITADVVQD